MESERPGLCLRSHEIKIVQADGIDEPEQAGGLASEIVERINSVWENRSISSCFQRKETSLDYRHIQTSA